MKKFLKKFQYGEKGFTLIELLVVIAILGILAAVAIPNLSKFMNSGRSQAAATELSIVQTNVVAYMADHNGSIPESEDDLAPYLSSDLTGSYTWDADGKVTQTYYPGVVGTEPE